MVLKLDETTELYSIAQEKYDCLSTEAKDLIRHQLDAYLELSSGPKVPSRLAELAADSELPRGLLVHGTKYDTNRLTSIKLHGVVSGQFFGISEEHETHFCADFFRVPEDMSVAAYVAYIQKPDYFGVVKRKKGESSFLPIPATHSHTDRRMAFLIDPTAPGLDRLTLFDAYARDAGDVMGEFTTLPKDRSKDTTAAILIGIPSQFIGGMILSTDLSDAEIEEVKTIMGDTLVYYSTTGAKL